MCPHLGRSTTCNRQLKLPALVTMRASTSLRLTVPQLMPLTWTSQGTSLPNPLDDLVNSHRENGPFNSTAFTSMSSPQVNFETAVCPGLTTKNAGDQLTSGNVVRRQRTNAFCGFNSSQLTAKSASQSIGTLGSVTCNFALERCGPALSIATSFTGCSFNAN